MLLNDFLARIGNDDSLDFEDTMAVIAAHYDYRPTAFDNGPVRNDAGQNEGSCKIFAFARLNDLDRDRTLACFGRFYRDVLATPDGSDHGNIRAFLENGWDGIRFDGEALIEKA
ncbi:type III effector [Marinobacterium nitratireducens]|uniref:Type III effector n=1 Tax=Marinobacterium nitratireducens TaxID=518897 RepID=A0A918DRT4_9GAMM|nr:HopJ type III effector protein [Marinobacterium nitratireducens]GGO79462.1 type III effector [Marinobacterium nitratireducens]